MPLKALIPAKSIANTIAPNRSMAVRKCCTIRFIWKIDELNFLKKPSSILEKAAYIVAVIPRIELIVSMPRVATPTCFPKTVLIGVINIFIKLST